jgi:hypothetical protein
MNSPASLLTATFAALLLASCGTSTIPTAEDMDRYYSKAEQMAQARIDILDEKRRRGEISQEAFEMQSATVRGRIPDHATELAWARHENVEARNRALGIPTGDHPVEVRVPGAGSGESFYRRAGEVSGSSQYNSAPYGGSVQGGPNRGDRPTLPPVQPPGAQPEPAVEPEPCP